MTDGPAGLVDVTKMDPSWAWAAGAMVSTTADLAHFYQALLGGQLLDPEQLRAMQTTVDASQQFGHGARYGLGLMGGGNESRVLEFEFDPVAETANLIWEYRPGAFLVESHLPEPDDTDGRVSILQLLQQLLLL